MKIQCPHCSAVFTTKPEYAGKNTKCTNCGGLFTIVELRENAAPVMPTQRPDQTAQSAYTATSNSNLGNRLGDESGFVIDTEKASSKKIAVIAVAVILIGLVVAVSVYLRRQDHPLISACEGILLNHLSSPSSYKPVSKEFQISLGSAEIKIEYDADNQYAATLRSNFVCRLGGGPLDKIVPFEFRKNSIGKSALEVLGFTEILSNGQKLSNPYSANPAMLADRDWPFYVKTPKHYILGWTTSEPLDFALSPEKPSADEIKRLVGLVETQEQERIAAIEKAKSEKEAAEQAERDRLAKLEQEKNERQEKELKDAKAHHIVRGLSWGMSQDEVIKAEQKHNDEAKIDFSRCWPSSDRLKCPTGQLGVVSGAEIIYHFKNKKLASILIYLSQHELDSSVNKQVSTLKKFMAENGSDRTSYYYGAAYLSMTSDYGTPSEDTNPIKPLTDSSKLKDFTAYLPKAGPYEIKTSWLINDCYTRVNLGAKLENKNGEPTVFLSYLPSSNFMANYGSIDGEMKPLSPFFQNLPCAATSQKTSQKATTEEPQKSVKSDSEPEIAFLQSMIDVLRSDPEAEIDILNSALVKSLSKEEIAGLQSAINELRSDPEMAISVIQSLIDQMQKDQSEPQATATPSQAVAPSPRRATTAINIPQYDTNSYCRVVGAGSYSIEKGCRDMEAEAKAALARMNVPANILSYCNEIATTGGDGGSYSILIGCIEMETEAKNSL